MGSVPIISTSFAVAQGESHVYTELTLTQVCAQNPLKAPWTLRPKSLRLFVFLLSLPPYLSYYRGTNPALTQSQGAQGRTCTHEFGEGLFLLCCMLLLFKIFVTWEILGSLCYVLECHGSAFHPRFYGYKPCGLLGNGSKLHAIPMEELDRKLSSWLQPGPAPV